MSISPDFRCTRERSAWGLAVILAAIVAIFPLNGYAQSEGSSPRGQGSLKFLVGVPVGEFADNVDQAGFGANVYAGAMLGTSPFQVGLDVSFLVYGRSRRTVPFSSTVGPAVEVDVVTTNSIIQPHAVFRVQPPTGVFRPYVEGLIGFKYLVTQTRVEDDRSNESIASTNNFNDFAWSGGLGAGVDIRVASSQTEAGKTQRYFINLGVQYLAGQEAEYLAEGELVDSNGDGALSNDELPIRRSRTNLVQPTVGFTIMF